MAKEPKKEIKIVRYKNDRAYQREAGKLIKKGWTVASVTSEQPRSGCGRILALGLFSALFKPKPVLVVTYSKG